MNAHLKCIDVEGGGIATSEWLGNTSGQFSLGNNFTLMFVVKRTELEMPASGVADSEGYLLYCGSPGNLFYVWISTPSVFDGIEEGTIQFTMEGVNGEIKDYSYPIADLLPFDEWATLFCTWDGGNLEIVSNERLFSLVDIENRFGEPSIVHTNASGVLNIEGGVIYLTGNGVGHMQPNIDCRLHSCAFWSTALPITSMSQIYNGGEVAFSDLTLVSGSYTEVDDLSHWWRFGFDELDIGKDFSVSGSLNLTQASFELDSGDIVDDYPGLV